MTMNEEESEISEEEERQLLQTLKPLIESVQVPPDFRSGVLAKLGLPPEEDIQGGEEDVLPVSPRVTPLRKPHTWFRAWTPALVAAGLVLSLTLHAWHLYRDLDQPSLASLPPSGERGSSEETLSTLLREGKRSALAGETDHAITAYREAIDQLALPLNELAWLLHTQGRAAEGLPLARLAVQLRPDQVEYLDTLITLLCKEGKPAEAVELLEQAAKQVPPRFHDRLERMRQGLCQ